MDNEFKEFVKSNRLGIIRTVCASRRISGRQEVNELFYDAAESVVNLMISKLGTDAYKDYKYGLTDFYLDVIKSGSDDVKLDKPFMEKYETLLTIPCQSNERAVTVLNHLLSKASIMSNGGFYPALMAQSIVIREEWGVFVVPENLMADYQFNLIILMTCSNCYTRYNAASWIVKHCFIPYRK